jgi:hypothetical protein
MVGVKGGAPMTLECVITEWEENERFLFRGPSEERTKASGKFSIAPTDKGCSVDFEEDLEMPGARGKIIAGLFRKKAKTKNIEECLQSLKEPAEKTASP